MDAQITIEVTHGNHFRLVFQDDGDKEPVLCVGGSYEDLKRIVLDGVNTMDERYITKAIQVEILDKAL